jgi:hypothetical protein
MGITLEQSINIAREHLVEQGIAFQNMAFVTEWPECFSVSFEPVPEEGELSLYLRVEVNRETGGPTLMMSR